MNDPTSGRDRDDEDKLDAGTRAENPESRGKLRRMSWDGSVQEIGSTYGDADAKPRAMSDYQKLEQDIDTLRLEVASVAHRVAGIQQTMETRWQDFKETTSERLESATREVDRAVKVTELLVETQETRLGRIEERLGTEIGGLRSEVGELRKEVREDLKANRLELEQKIDASRSQAVSTIGIFIGVAALFTTVAMGLITYLLG